MLSMSSSGPGLEAAETVVEPPGDGGGEVAGGGGGMLHFRGDLQIKLINIVKILLKQIY